MWVHVCVCVTGGERKKGGGGDREREGGGEGLCLPRIEGV